VRGKVARWQRSKDQMPEAGSWELGIRDRDMDNGTGIRDKRLGTGIKGQG